jgi:hypothetical protein
MVTLEYCKIDSIGKGTTFYSLLEVEPSANLGTINKAYRKKSLQMQYVHTKSGPLTSVFGRAGKTVTSDRLAPIKTLASKTSKSVSLVWAL